MSDRTGANNVLSPEDHSFNARRWSEQVTAARKAQSRKLTATYTAMAHQVMVEARELLKYSARWTLPVDYCAVAIEAVRVGLEVSGFTAVLAGTHSSRHTLTISWRPQ